MRILELEIWKVRGIKHLLIAPEGNNFLIYGPNGTGKSAVVDALDFLLTGQISRLSGKGTRAKQIQELLNITEVERTRKLFVSAKRDIQNRLEATRGELDAARGAISKTIQSPAWNNQDIINIVNYYRSILGGHPVSDIDWRGLKTALKPPGIFEDREMAGPEYLQNDIDYLKAVFQDSNQMTIENLDRQLRTLVERILSLIHI